MKSFPTDSRCEFPLQQQLYPMKPRVPNTSKLWAKCKTVKSHKINKLSIHTNNKTSCRYCWPCCLRRGSAAARLLGLWVRIPPGEWMCVSCQCCMLSGRGLCLGLITHPEESYRLWRVVVRDIETSLKKPCPRWAAAPQGWTNKTFYTISTWELHSVAESWRKL